MIRIIGTGTYVPEKVLTNHDIEKMVDTSDTWIVTRTGIRQRRIAGDDQAASDLGAEAAKEAIRTANLQVHDIDLIIVSKKFNKVRPLERGLNLYDYWKIDSPVDFLCYTPEEFKKAINRIGLVAEAMKNGIIIYNELFHK